ncbi:uncharacterized protein B0H64DRAFT_85287 [Chaetomium fimeti]|uniref:Uncharacterized protein n=1 Tax=Chaetomium fimeti TaxID=1854472 RepID=A0AAE0LW55_9PEZI|nr:hypothetical protein B0H64DRAFT_85287 [Chaetomium fimeti]
MAEAEAEVEAEVEDGMENGLDGCRAGVVNGEMDIGVKVGVGLLLLWEMMGFRVGMGIGLVCVVGVVVDVLCGCGARGRVDLTVVCLRLVAGGVLEIGRSRLLSLGRERSRRRLEWCTGRKRQEQEHRRGVRIEQVMEWTLAKGDDGIRNNRPGERAWI